MDSLHRPIVALSSLEAGRRCLARHCLYSASIECWKLLRSSRWLVRVATDDASHCDHFLQSPGCLSLHHYRCVLSTGGCALDFAHLEVSETSSQCSGSDLGCLVSAALSAKQPFGTNKASQS